ncbi:MAG: manganese efflux pump MntP family protein [Lachnospiraceae bacterium]|nr:manganese efflux pump MntP family protein [Ruminococcus sp.]MCM1277212.1 manganese efflux pump MntP family protein [Lachnospiraceae bacterium]
MELDIIFFVNSILLGFGLSVDAFSVSLANGLNDPKMGKGKMCVIAGTFAGFQFTMPFIGWVCVRTAAHFFNAFEKFIPWIALVLLLFIGGKTVFEGIKGDDDNGEACALNFGAILLQGLATSIDELSAGFMIAEYDMTEAVISVLMIAVVTFAACIAGLIIGKKFGTKLSGKVQVLGGVILIGIGIEIFVKGIIS